MEKGMGILHVLRHHALAFEQQDRQELGEGQGQEEGDSHQILEDRQGQGQEQEQENSQSLEDRQGQEQEQEENSQSLEQVGVVHMRNILNKICQQRSKFSIKIHIPYGEHLVLQGQDHFAVDIVQEASQGYVDFSQHDVQQTELVEGK
ncbi:uncharacterized protein EDB91DRAFT_1084599 [Suillus paluster]|uniref:uncharacterized protein n=1 Tax=Suillus paluster TaxID=48578 RepID=UPI001B8788CA|nr:uncharacterized protein EDB91DRAFT_1084599 [Suillus paluster]KAG1732852.1 hypothetical protein EDB91DRAFT_1084599 [Suillus paluster]